jgi:uncharacterized protein (TIGR02147 family)
MPFLGYITHMTETKLPIIYDYMDFVKYLRDYYEARHAIDRWFSYRYIQSKTGIDPGYLYKIFQGKKALPQKKIPTFATMLGFSKREKEYFTLLVMYGQAKTNESIRRYFEKMLQFREVPMHTMLVGEYEYYTKWYYAAIRQILSIIRFSGDFAALARMTVPAITPTEAKKSIALLCKLGLVEKLQDGSYRSIDKFLSTGENWHSIAVRRFQQETIGLAHQALDTVPKEQRDVSTVTVTLSKEAFNEARERIRQFRQDMIELINMGGDPEGVYHVNIQMIPIGRLVQGRVE